MFKACQTCSLRQRVLTSTRISDCSALQVWVLFVQWQISESCWWGSAWCQWGKHKHGDSNLRAHSGDTVSARGKHERQTRGLPQKHKYRLAFLFTFILSTVGYLLILAYWFHGIWHFWNSLKIWNQFFRKIRNKPKWTASFLLKSNDWKAMSISRWATAQSTKPFILMQHFKYLLYILRNHNNRTMWICFSELCSFIQQ